MAGTTITAAEINTRMNAAITALDAGDYATAYTKALGAQGMLAVKPDTDFSDEGLKWDREFIANFVKEMKQLSRGAKASTAITQIPVRSRSSWTGFDDDCTC